MSVFSACLVLLVLSASGGPFLYPQVEAVLLPGERCSFEVGGEERACFHFGGPKPFIYPLIGPAGRPVTAMLHPEDPHGHRHHRSIWISHMDVAGQSFWEADLDTQITKEAVLAYRSGAQAASWSLHYAWRDPQGEALLKEIRSITLHALPGKESYLDIAMRFSAASKPVQLGKTPFGFLGLRVSPTMSVLAGDGRVMNSEGKTKVGDCHWKHARWIDYSGSVSAQEKNGVAIFDHPENPRFPTVFHVRVDGWIGVSFCYEAAYELEAGKNLDLSYRIYAHAGGLDASDVEGHWKSFADAPRPQVLLKNRP